MWPSADPQAKVVLARATWLARFAPVGPLGGANDTLNAMQLLAIDRDRYFRLAREGGTLSSRSPAVALSHREVFCRYRGFDGEWWPVSPPHTMRCNDGFVAM